MNIFLTNHIYNLMRTDLSTVNLKQFTTPTYDLKSNDTKNENLIGQLLKVPLLFCFLIFNLAFIQNIGAQIPADPVGLDARITPPTAGSGEIFLAVGPNQVGMNNTVYRLFYSLTASAPVDPKTATQYIFGSTAGDGNGTSAFGFMLTGLTPGTSYTFWLYQFNTSSGMYSNGFTSDVQISGAAAPPATNVTFCVDYTCVAQTPGFAAQQIYFEGGPSNGYRNLTNMGNNIWCGTFAIPAGEVRFNFFFAGASGAGGPENLTGLACTSNGAGGLKRSFNVSGTSQSVTYAWQSCAATASCGPTSPTDSPATPTCPAANVINIYGGGYPTNIATNYNPFWGQSGTVNPNFDPGTGNVVMAYTNFNFQGTDLTQTNASSMKYLHFDVWTVANPAITTLKVSPINFGTGPAEVLVTVPFTSGTWTKVTLPKSAFGGMTWDAIRQLKFEAFGGTPTAIYLDNIYFSTCDVPSPYCNTSAYHLGIPAETATEIKLSIGNSGENSMTVDIESATASPADVLIVEGAAGATISPFVEVSPGKLRSILRWLNGPPPSNVMLNVLWSKANFGGNWILRDISIPFIAVCPTIPLLPTAPTTAAPLPTCPSDQVISLFSNSYSNVSVNTFLTPWSQAPVTLTNTQVAGNDVKFYQNVTFLGIETTSAPINASAMTTLHVDFWSANATQIRIKLVDLGPDGTFAGPNPEFELTFNNPKLGEWVSYEIPLSSFTGLTSRSNLAQYILSGMPNGVVDFYIDNMYFSNCALPSGWSEQGVNCPGTNYSYNPTSQVFTGTSVNCYYPNSFVSDELASAQRQLCGNGTITARVTSISGSALGWAGVTMRESNAAGSKKAQLMTNLSEFSRREFRTATDGTAYPQQFASQSRYWLRITRTGNQFVMFISPNGTTWYPAGAQTIIMPNCIQVGLVITNYTENSSVTAKFSNVTVTGGNQTKPASNGNISEDIFADADFTVMPNPTSGYVEINMNAYGKKDVQMEIYNVQGKLMRSTKIDASRGIEEVDMTSFVNGMYLIRMKAEGLPDVTKRIVIQH
jgi:regulation of enolase protein 1 (concanavalin A-like superfamily)